MQVCFLLQQEKEGCLCDMTKMKCTFLGNHMQPVKCKFFIPASQGSFNILFGLLLDKVALNIRRREVQCVLLGNLVVNSLASKQLLL